MLTGLYVYELPCGDKKVWLVTVVMLPCHNREVVLLLQLILHKYLHRRNAVSLGSISGGSYGILPIVRCDKILSVVKGLSTHASQQPPTSGRRKQVNLERGIASCLHHRWLVHVNIDGILRFPSTRGFQRCGAWSTTISLWNQQHRRMSVIKKLAGILIYEKTPANNII